MTTMEKIEEFLKKMNLTYRYIPTEDRIILPYEILNRRFLLVIDRSDKWVRFFVTLVEAESLKNVDKPALYKALLEANGELAEVKYYVTDTGSVGVIGHEGIQALTYEGFEQEYSALPFAVSYFIENIASKLKINVPGVQ
jgi:hypothetical protein